MVEVSVIMPVCDAKVSYVREAIDSVLAQTFKDFEFLILNDSPKNADLRNAILSYKDDRIKYFENDDNIGIPKSYNRLLDLAKGKYVAIMNHDDIMKPRRLAKQYEYMEKHSEVGLLGTGYKKFGEINRFKKIVNPLSHDEICSCLLFKSAVHHPTIMLRREIVEKYKIKYNENFVSLNDRQLCCEFSKYSKLANLPDVLYKYRFHEGMVSKRQKDVIIHEREMFHKLWFSYHNIDLTPNEIEIFDHYTTFGRRKILRLDVLETLVLTLEKLRDVNAQRKVYDCDAVEKLCAKYATKRCLNALWHGHLDIGDIIKKTSLHVDKRFLYCLNAVFGWKKGQ